MTSKKIKAPAGGAAGALKKSKSRSDGSPKGAVAEATQSKVLSKSTTSQAQRNRILAELRTGPKTSYDLRRCGCYQAPTRIWELIHVYGCLIDSDRVTVVDQDGYTHTNVALYTLVYEPERLVRQYPATSTKNRASPMWPGAQKCISAQRGLFDGGLA